MYYYQWDKEQAGNKHSCKVMLVGTEGGGATFLQACFPDIKKIGSINLEDTSTRNRNNPINGCGVYTLDRNTAVVIVLCQYLSI